MASLNVGKGHIYFDEKEANYSYSHYKSFDYSNDDAIDNVIHYITRTGKRSNRNDLIAWGSAGCCSYYATPEEIINQFKVVQEICRAGKDINSKIVHEILTFSPSEQEVLLADIASLIRYAKDCASIYFSHGFQCVYGIHDGYHCSTDNSNVEKKLHIHFCVNAVNYQTGNLFRTKRGNKAYSLNNGETFFKVPYDTKEREKLMNSLLYEKYLLRADPYQVEDFNDYLVKAYHQYNI